MFLSVVICLWLWPSVVVANNPFVWKGTRWCGYGSLPHLNKTMVAKQQPVSSAVDECCRQHDHCPHFIPRWKRKYNLLNWRPFTISECECDRTFRKCLRNDSSVAAKDIQRIYFNILEVPCFTLELREEKKCVDRTWFFACKQRLMTTQAYAVLQRLTTP